MLKLVFGSKNKIVKLEKPIFTNLYTLIKQSFSELPPDFTLSYLDLDKDQISLNSDEDLTIMLSSGVKMNKIYIKQSLSQVIEITNQIEPSFDSLEIYDSSLKKVQLDEKPSEQFLVDFKINQEAEAKPQPQLKQEAKEAVKQEKKTQEIKLEIIEEVKIQSKTIEVIPEKIEIKIQASKEEAVIPQPQISVNADIVASQLKETIAELVKKEVNEKYQKIKSEIVEQKPKKEVNALVVEEKQVSQRRGKALIYNFKDNESEQVLVYHGVICHECKDEYGIIGVRYQCLYCENYNICEKCEAIIDHAHSLVKVKDPKKVIKKEDLIEKYKTEIFKNIPPNHYVPSISRDEVKRYIQLSQKTINDSYQNSKRYMNEMFQKLEMSHKNPYEVAKKIEYAPPPYVKPINNKQKIKYLMDLFGIPLYEAQRFCNKYHDFTREQLADLYVKER